MSIVERKKQGVRRLVVVRDADLGCLVVYQVRRLTASMLLAQGVAGIPGMADALKAAEGATGRWDLQARLNDCKTEEEREAVREADRAQEAELVTRMSAELLADASRTREMLDLVSKV